MYKHSLARALADLDPAERDETVFLAQHIADAESDPHPLHTHDDLDDTSDYEEETSNHASTPWD